MKTAPQIEQRISYLKARLTQLEKVWSAPQITPGPLATGRSNYSMGKQLDRENNRKADAFRNWQESKRELDILESRLTGYLSGNYHLDGRPKASSPARERQKKFENIYAEFMKSRLRVGDKVALAANPTNTITVIRINQTSVTDGQGERWKYSEILPTSNGQVMSDEETRKALSAFMKDIT